MKLRLNISKIFISLQVVFFFFQRKIKRTLVIEFQLK